MAKPKIPKKEVTLRSSEDTERLEMVAQIETILGHAKYRLTLLGAFAFLLLGLLVTGAQNLHQLNTQGIAYILLAKHYVNGDWALAISSYWSPLLSWIIALGLKIGWDAPTAARVATGLSGLLLWIGTVSLLFVTKASIRALLSGAWLVAFAAIPWSTDYISPDLLAAALLVAAMATSIYTFRIRSTKGAIVSGVLWGLVYYSHGLLLPVVAISLLGLGFIGHFGSPKQSKSWGKQMLVQCLVAIVVMAPWWATLSATYKQPTIGSAWAIDHAVSGPQDVDRYHPCFGQFNPPAEGRLANWEDPARLDYFSWSPFSSVDNKIHQTSLMKRDFKSMLEIFLGFGAFGVGLIAIATCLFLRPWQVRDRLSETWRWVLFPIIGLVLAFLPFAITPLDSRFYYACFPLMMVSAFCFLEWLPEQAGWDRFPVKFASTVLAILFALPMIPRFAASLEGMANPGGYAILELVDRMKASNISGTVAGDGMLMGTRTGLAIAALLNEKWVGDSPDVVGTDYLSCGADLIIVHRQHRVNSDMEFSPAFRDLDTILFSDKMQADEFPLRVYQVNR
jgi:hypothetical protein